MRWGGTIRGRGPHEKPKRSIVLINRNQTLAKRLSFSWGTNHFQQPVNGATILEAMKGGERNLLVLLMHHERGTKIFQRIIREGNNLSFNFLESYKGAEWYSDMKGMRKKVGASSHKLWSFPITHYNFNRRYQRGLQSLQTISTEQGTRWYLAWMWRKSRVITPLYNTIMTSWNQTCNTSLVIINYT